MNTCWFLQEFVQIHTTVRMGPGFGEALTSMAKKHTIYVSIVCKIIVLGGNNIKS